MKASVKWINAYLNPGDISAADAEQVLTFAGLPIDSNEPLPGGDVRMEVEVTSNRGDCLCHTGWAREIAAATGRTLKLPSLGTPAKRITTLDGFVLTNEVAQRGCPRFTLRRIVGVKVGPSPAWLRERLEAIGQRSINNVVDVTNFVLHELGQPSHVFDARTIKGQALAVRAANKGEKLALLDGRTLTLTGGELVIADASGPVSLAGVMGGLPTSVTEATTDVLLEVATWDPVLVRTASRRHNTRTDSSYRYERTVDARTIDAASARLVELITQVAGGRVIDGQLDEGLPLAPAETCTLRAARIESVLGIPVPPEEVERVLRAHGFVAAASAKGQWSVTIPPHRADVRLEIDLIEEVARTIGYDKLTVAERLPVRVGAPQTSERARRELIRILTGMGFFETVTFSFTSSKQARLFTPPGLQTVSVADDKRGDEGVLRPSILCGLLACRKANQDGRVHAEGGGGVRLFELAAVYGENAGASIEHRNVALILDVPAGGSAFERRQAGVRLMRGAIEQLARSLSGEALTFEVPRALPFSALDPAASAAVSLGGKPLGIMGIITPAAQSLYDLQNPVAVAELNVERLIAGYPPRAAVKELPLFPPVERDLSADVDERTSWASIVSVIESWSPGTGGLLEDCRFVTTYRGKPLDTGKKSVTFRMTFRDAARTLRDDDVNPHVDRLMSSLREKVGAAFRSA